MDNEVNKFKIKYNHWLKRRLKAEKYFEENPDTCLKFLLEFHEVTTRLSLLPKEYFKLTGENITDKEIMEGFREV